MIDSADLLRHKQTCYADGSPVPGCPVCAHLQRATAVQESKRYKSRSVTDFADKDDPDKPQQNHMTILSIEADEDVKWFKHTDGILDVLEARERSRRWPSKEEIEDAVATVERPNNTQVEEAAQAAPQRV